MTRSRVHAPLLGALAAALLLAGCNTGGGPAPTPATPSTQLGSSPTAPVNVAPPATPSPTKPTTPAAATAPTATVKPASIIGSEETSTMFDNFTAYVATIDGQAFSDRNGWSRPLPLTPGVHKLKLAFIRGVFFAQTEVRITARSGARYKLQFATDAHVFGKNTYCEFWIEDTLTGDKVLAPTRVPLSRVEPAAQK